MIPLVELFTRGIILMADYVENFPDNPIVSDWWPVGSSVKLCRVSWDSSYRDVVVFDNLEQKYAYFDNLSDTQSYTVESMSYLKPGMPIKVPIPYSTAYRYNYIEVRNPRSPRYEDTRFYYFISRADYVSPSTTMLTIQLDVMMSYQHNVTLASCFVERGHVAMANRTARDMKALGNFSAYMQEYLDVPEGLDVGSDYVTAYTECYSLSSQGYYVMVLATGDLTADPGTVNAPNLDTATGLPTDRLISGCDLWAFEQADFTTWISSMKGKSWVTQTIVAIYTFPKRLIEDVEAHTLGVVTAYRVTNSTSMTVDPNDASASMMTMSGMFNLIKSRLHPSSVKHDKFCIFPYSFIEVTANTGTSILLKPQYLQNDELALKAICCAVYPFARIGVVPWNYGKGSLAGTYSVAWRDPAGNQRTSVMPADSSLQNALYLANFPMFSIVNNNYITYMASTAHSREYSYQAAGWQLARTNMASALSYDQAVRGMDTAEANQAISQRAGYEQMAIGIGTGAIGAVGQFATGNIGKGINAAANTAASAANSAISLGANQAQFNNSQNLTAYQAATNYAFAQQAAQGDYAMAIQAIDSKVQDAALIAPSQVGQSGGDAFAAANGLFNITVNIKVITEGAMARIADFWSRYGYQVNQFIHANNRPMRALKVMTRFSYWRMRECYVRNPNASNMEVMAIKGILERGCTIWGDPNDIGSVSIDSNAVDETKTEWSY